MKRRNGEPNAKQQRRNVSGNLEKCRAEELLRGSCVVDIAVPTLKTLVTVREKASIDNKTRRLTSNQHSRKFPDRRRRCLYAPVIDKESFATKRDV